MGQKLRQLTNGELKALLGLPYDGMRKTFPEFSEKHLQRERKRAKELFPELVGLGKPMVQPDPLTDEQLKLLLKTPQDDWSTVFVGYPRSFLRHERQRAVAKFPPERKIVAQPELVVHGIDLLQDEELKLLLDTPADDWPRVFQGYPRSFLRAERERARAKFPPQVLIDIDAKKKLDETRWRETDRLYQAAVHELEETKQRLAAATSFPTVAPRDMSIKSTKEGEREATAVALFSDIHCEEHVTRESTNGQNEYNLEIFDYRARCYFANLLKLIAKESKAIAINNLVIAVLGDLISGEIHADIRTLLGPMQAIALAQDTLAGGIHQILAATPKTFKITLVFKWGNHSRTTPEQRIASEADFSLEWLMAHSIAREFKDNPRVTIVREEAPLTYLDVHGFKLRFLHGHCIGYSGGVGGITIPVLKAIKEWDSSIPAHCTFFGHFHQYIPHARFIANGSMIGYSPYATWVKAAFEPPRQAFCLIDSEYGKTVQAPIILESV